jgi:hypothetical protein
MKIPWLDRMKKTDTPQPLSSFQRGDWVVVESPMREGRSFLQAHQVLTEYSETEALERIAIGHIVPAKKSNDGQIVYSEAFDQPVEDFEPTTLAYGPYASREEAIKTHKLGLKGTGMKEEKGI